MGIFFSMVALCAPLAMIIRVAPLFVLFLFTPLWVTLNLCDATTNDLLCLETLKASLKDPYLYLDSWDLSNTTEGSICSFNGIDCWHLDENKVLSIRLSDMGLQGPFPKGLHLCESMTGLDLSNNELTGIIPSNVSKSIPFVTTLDLSYNNFYGAIPIDLANCTYLNVIKLQNNRLTGHIPGQLTRLDRLNTFNVADNLLSGPIPVFNKSKDASYYANNFDLCGPPLEACQVLLKKENARQGPVKKVNQTTIVGAIVGGVMFAVICLAVLAYFHIIRVPLVLQHFRNR